MMDDKAAEGADDLKNAAGIVGGCSNVLDVVAKEYCLQEHYCRG